jgi:hypothetical protein
VVSGDIKTFTHESDHEDGSTGHDHLVTVPSNQVPSELKSKDFSDVGTVGDWFISSCEYKLPTCSLPRSSDRRCTINDLISKSVVERG